jgi:hypothetical protein
MEKQDLFGQFPMQETRFGLGRGRPAAREQTTSARPQGDTGKAPVSGIPEQKLVE